MNTAQAGGSLNVSVTVSRIRVCSMGAANDLHSASRGLLACIAARWAMCKLPHPVHLPCSTTQHRLHTDLTLHTIPPAPLPTAHVPITRVYRLGQSASAIPILLCHVLPFPGALLQPGSSGGDCSVLAKWQCLSLQCGQRECC